VSVAADVTIEPHEYMPPRIPQPNRRLATGSRFEIVGACTIRAPSSQEGTCQHPRRRFIVIPLTAVLCAVGVLVPSRVGRHLTSLRADGPTRPPSGGFKDHSRTQGRSGQGSMSVAGRRLITGVTCGIRTRSRQQQGTAMAAVSTLRGGRTGATQPIVSSAYAKA
jgi:hypothetical protein